MPLTAGLRKILKPDVVSLVTIRTFIGTSVPFADLVAATNAG